jgi:6-phosphogluconolactonase
MLVLVGTYTEPIVFGTGKVVEGKGEGIYAFRVDESSGALQAVGATAGVANPSYLAPDATGRFLYAVNELKVFGGRPSGTVSAFAIGPADATLRALNTQLTHGTDPCHVAVHPQGKHVFVANFMSGSVCVLPVRDDGSLGAACDFVQHQGSGIDPQRQRGPHAHAVTFDPSGRFAFVPDLGLDRVMIYRFDNRRGMLEPNAPPWIKMRPGAGPRHLAFHPGGRFAYLANELDSTVAALSFDATSGALEHLQSVPTLPDDFAGDSTCAHIDVHPCGRFVYVSNRGHDSIAIHRVDARSGKLTCVGHAQTRGRTPRSFGIDPGGRFLFAANQDSDCIVAFRIDSDTGALRAIGEAVRVPTPVCVKFLSPQSAAGRYVGGAGSTVARHSPKPMRRKPSRSQ